MSRHFKIDRSGSDLRLTKPDLSLHLTPERAIYWEEGRSLILSDFHLGKDETFRHHGIPIPEAVGKADLDRLLNLSKRFPAERIVIAGDFLHHPNGYNATTINLFQNYREKIAASIVVITGNHERSFRSLPRAWQIEFLPDECSMGPIQFIHDPEDYSEKTGHSLTIAGHWHPVVKLSRKVRLPCFHLNQSLLVLPAFTRFSSGLSVGDTDRGRNFVIAKKSVLDPPEFIALKNDLNL